MAGLLDSLSTATSALTAYRTGLDVVGQNIANINTPGYSRRTLMLAERPPTETPGAGHGVEVLEIRALRDQYVDIRIGREQAGQAHDSAVLGGVTEVEAAIGLPGNSLDARITAFFDGFSGLSGNVTSPSERDNVVRNGQSLAAGFADLSGRYSELQRVTDRSIVDAVGELNRLAETVATLNARINTGGADVEALRDERGTALARLAELADISIISRSDQAVDVTVGGGRALVVGASAYQVQTIAGPPSGFSALTLGDADITAATTNGRIGGLLTLRDRTVPGYQTQLDQLAHDFVTQVNAVHVTGFDGAGAAAGNFFTPPAAVAGAAASISVEAAVVADVNLVAGSGTGASGDNQTALAIAALRDARVMSGGTATASEAWSNIVYEVGSDVASARAATTTRTQVVRQLERLRDQASGVSLDEEAANLMRYQRSYEASARFFTAIVDTLDTLMAMVR